MIVAVIIYSLLGWYVMRLLDRVEPFLDNHVARVLSFALWPLMLMLVGLIFALVQASDE